MGDLSRHISWCIESDWYDIILFDAPDILAKAEQYAKGIESSSGELEQYIHSRFRPRYEIAMREKKPDFYGLILTCCVDLATHFKRKSGAEDDSEGEIGRVFKVADPVLIAPSNLSTDTGRNVQRETLLLMQGWRAFVRNTHAHEVQPTDREYAIHALMLMSLLARIIDFARLADEGETAG